MAQSRTKILIMYQKPNTVTKIKKKKKKKQYSNDLNPLKLFISSQNQKDYSPSPD